MIPLILAGAAFQAIGQYGANIDQAMAEKRNADFFREQANYARDAMARELDLTDRSYTYKIGAQRSAAAAGGVDVGSGSIVNDLAQSAADRVEELIAVRKKGELDIKLAASRATVADQDSARYSSIGYNANQMGGTLIKGYSDQAYADKRDNANASLIAKGQT